MAVQAIRIEGRAESTLDGLGRHNQRLSDGHSNADIVIERKEKNVEQVGGSGTFRTRWRNAINATGATYRPRKNGSAFCEMIITSGEDFFKGLGYSGSFDGRTRDFFMDAMAWAKKALGYGSGQNIFSAVVHLDETTPHLHLCFVPVAEYDKKKRGHVVEVCKDVFFKQRGGRGAFSMLQDDFSESVGKKYEQGRGVLKDISQKKHVPIGTLKKMTYTEILQEKQDVAKRDLVCTLKNVLIGRTLADVAKRDLVCTVKNAAANQKMRDAELRCAEADQKFTEAEKKEKEVAIKEGNADFRFKKIEEHEKRLYAKEAEIEEHEKRLYAKEAEAEEQKADADYKAQLYSADIKSDSGKMLLVNEGRRREQAREILGTVKHAFEYLCDMICTYFHLAPNTENRYTPRDYQVIKKAIAEDILPPFDGVEDLKRLTQNRIRTEQTEKVREKGGRVLPVDDPGESESKLKYHEPHGWHWER